MAVMFTPLPVFVYYFNVVSSYPWLSSHMFLIKYSLVGSAYCVLINNGLHCISSRVLQYIVVIIVIITNKITHVQLKGFT